MAPFTGPFSGAMNGPVGGKAAMSNQPCTHGIVGRTLSGRVASSLDTLRANDYAVPPADLEAAGGSLEIACQRPAGTLLTAPAAPSPGCHPRLHVSRRAILR